MRQYHYITEMMRVALQDLSTLRIKGRVVQVVGTIIKAVVPMVKIGEVCLLRNPGEDFEMHGEVVGFVRDAALLTPIGDMYGISSATEVIPTGRTHMVPVGPGLLGRVLDGLGRPLDAAESGPLHAHKFYPVFADAPDPLTRRIIHAPLELGCAYWTVCLHAGKASVWEFSQPPAAASRPCWACWSRAPRST
ncbi:type III secretion system ATPase [Bordetella pertussis]|nr:type III secretion system ATPase [Bordetella pertussis]